MTTPAIPTTTETPAVVCRCLDCSTAHITNSDGRLLEAASVATLPKLQDRVRASEDDRLLSAVGNPSVVIGYDTGWFLILPAEDEDFEILLGQLRDHHYSEAFVNLYRFARSAGCDQIRLDADGTRYVQLPEFVW